MLLQLPCARCQQRLVCLPVPGSFVICVCGSEYSIDELDIEGVHGITVGLTRARDALQSLDCERCGVRILLRLVPEVGLFFSSTGQDPDGTPQGSYALFGQRAHQCPRCKHVTPVPERPMEITAPQWAKERGNLAGVWMGTFTQKR